jgi:hypothetical protein
MANLYVQNPLPEAAPTLSSPFSKETRLYQLKGMQTSLDSETTCESLTDGVSLDRIVPEDYSMSGKASC